MGDNSTSDIGDAALYHLERFKRSLDALDGKPTWDLADTADFDCMHYLGDVALEKAAKALDLKPGQTVVDIGSGFSATGRYLSKHYGVDVTGIELQPEIHELAELITARNGLSEHVRSVNADFTTLTLDAPVDHIISFLCILHIADRDTLFKKAASALKPGGKMYIEDYFARTTLSKDVRDTLRNIASCPYLPNRDQYIADLAKAGFKNIQFEDMTEEWAKFVHERAVSNRQGGTTAAPLTLFYDTIDALFAGGELGGVRITATKA
ncbi:uncharacterized protein TRIREDRAFT_111110 [Trichoderma reesei QM6a]|jgi:SAM-dependent methyltransferase|uniref:phosphoethanolamine N-methyltransferase n=2 Tax=Hypocrea jecorina TaxID=51453 RepID=G0RTS3_HYPJQ|nr:uncharacterized protein TRIREDRAFT_111110 [Trichoderma reesei QM6a]EGR45411.1 predicted protein [Trichoderma reesei QM6a]ETR98650.1 methyl transferase-like protein [Trichoderma reesei RUT C-30]